LSSQFLWAQNYSWAHETSRMPVGSERTALEAKRTAAKQIERCWCNSYGRGTTRTARKMEIPWLTQHLPFALHRSGRFGGSPGFEKSSSSVRESQAYAAETRLSLRTSKRIRLGRLHRR